ncbi:coiled-coil domain-containing protein 62 isoform X1 [Podarcis raffonei]|uniref:coiled-coil domain-containing protein 62 isoform X1 n=1 Tax=Podarcis raffonei TaxID=65483 RepID=UPI0023295036|nr:coiled-coil domain-containing protein 62 isoform X1 [Podarcis raffonei]XP_053224056.1 coiled-coil domain-containing protein 62 isoform X1 [Podarcis raffonei]XP_053224057.1 coiled-coil domain-containing protein 62 isoform X1 [Podarcis raffonei]
MESSLPLSTPQQNTTSELESSTIQKQRKELQLLIVELKDRDKELNDMVAVHQRQLLAWDDDRQKILTLAERCSKLENELHKRNEMISTLTRRLKHLESQQNDRKITLENTQQKLQELSRKASDTSLHCQALEEKNQALSCSVMELSNKVGQLQAREQELLTMLKLKDNDILEATNHITEFTCKFKKLENALRAAKMEESSVNREKQDFKLRLKELMLETSKLKGDISEKTKENNEQREEIIRLKQENNYLNNELMLSAERANRKDQLLQSAKSKQLRTDTELSNLRQIYVKQQRDLQFLHFNLESSQETKQKHKTQAHEASTEIVLSDPGSSGNKDTACSETHQKIHTRFVHSPSCSSKNICEAHRAENRQQKGPEERQPASLDQFQEGLFYGPRTMHREELDQSGSLSSGETDSRPASQSDSMWKAEGREMARAPEQSFAASLPIHEHWLDLNCHTEPTNCQSPVLKLSDKSNEDCKDKEMGTCGLSPSKSPSPFKGLESGYCSRSSINKVTLYQPVSDQRWMQIFKPVKGEAGSWHGAFPNGAQAAIRSGKSKSDHDVDLHFSDLGAPCLTSTQKTSGSKGDEKLFEGELPSEFMSLTDIQAANGCCHLTIHKDSCSPTSKLQRLLAESRQMVANLELSNLLGPSPGCSPNNSLYMAGEYSESLCKGRLPSAEESEMKLSLFSL